MPEFKLWEIVVLLFGALLLTSSTAVYLSGISLRSYVLGWDDKSVRQPQVGRLAKKVGGIRRQLSNGREFIPLVENTPLFNYDTVVTGPDSSAVIRLDDDSSIELGPNTMIRLAFEKELSLGGVSRAASVEVVSGQVSGQAKSARKLVLRTRDRVIPLSQQKETIQIAATPVRGLAKPIAFTPPPMPKAAPAPVAAPKPLAAAPSPSPSPSPSPTPTVHADAQIVMPKNGASFVVDETGEKPRKSTTLEWKTHTPAAEFQVVLKHQDEVVLTRVVQMKDLIGRLPVTLDRPGKYTWEIREPTGEPLAKPVHAEFELEPEFDAIETLPYLIGGEATSSNAYNGEQKNDFGITFRWKPYPGVKDYIVRLSKSVKGGKTLLERKVRGEEYSFNKDKIFSGTLYYVILGRLPSGFLARSKATAFNFSFAPPKLVMPPASASVSLASLNGSSNGLLFTWQKTNFTEDYEVELSTDPAFKSTLMKKKVKENFMLLKVPTAGRYYWHVRALSKTLNSPFSSPRELRLVP
jgi:hypothetical protein